MDLFLLDLLYTLSMLSLVVWSMSNDPLLVANTQLSNKYGEVKHTIFPSNSLSNVDEQSLEYQRFGGIYLKSKYFKFFWKGQSDKMGPIILLK